MRSAAVLALLLSFAACAAPTTEEPSRTVEESTGPADFADVAGRVTRASGGLVVSGAVTITCAGGALGVTLPIGADGLYGGSLSLPTAIVNERGTADGHVRCRFRVDGPAGVRIRLDTLVGFGRPGLPHVLQVFNLRAAP